MADAEGRTIGIATAALTRLHGVVLPWTTVDRVLEHLQSHGRVVQPYVGIVAQAVRLNDAQAADLGVTRAPACWSPAWPTPAPRRRRACWSATC